VDRTRQLALFLEEAEERLAAVESLLAVEPGETRIADPEPALLRHAHSLKGLAATLGLEDIAETAHRLEDLVLRGTRPAPGESPGIADVLADLRTRVAGVALRASRSEPTIRVPRAVLHGVLGRIERLRRAGSWTTGCPGCANLVLDLERDLRGILADRLDTLVDTLRDAGSEASRASGHLADLRVIVDSPGDARTERALDAVFDALVQLVRNAIVHGIEPPEERGQIGKPVWGRVLVRVRRTAREVRVEVEDDGRGFADLPSGPVPRDVLAQRCRRRASGVVNVSVLCGRGLGLGSVREAVASLGGRLRLRNVPGGGARWTLAVPLDVPS
jgi:chemotaxis protein histidine kinase CheA